MKEVNRRLQARQPKPTKQQKSLKKTVSKSMLQKEAAQRAATEVQCAVWMCRVHGVRDDGLPVAVRVRVRVCIYICVCVCVCVCVREGAGHC